MILKAVGTDQDLNCDVHDQLDKHIIDSRQHINKWDLHLSSSIYQYVIIIWLWLWLKIMLPKKWIMIIRDIQ